MVAKHLGASVLIVSNNRDAHVPLVTRILAERGVTFFVFNTEEFGEGVLGSFSLNSRPGLFLDNGSVSVDLNQIRSVWYRRPELPELTHIHEQDARKFAQHEQKAFLDGILASLDCRWLSHPASIREAGHKLKQLGVARELGFNVPPTLISQSPQEIREFYESLACPLAAKLVAKGPPRTDRPDDQYVIFTQVLNRSDLSDDTALSACVAMYQPYIEKKYELRVTVVGKEVYACRIDSQASEKTRVDWRNYDLANTPHSTYDLDSTIQKRCIELVQKFGLNYGAIDFIATPEGQLFFLEINPNGQWGWIEELTNMPIAESHARFLSQH